MLSASPWRRPSMAAPPKLDGFAPRVPGLTGWPGFERNWV